MIDASATHRVLRIGELTRAITSHLILVGQKNTVNLACACQCLEEPVLSTLWEEQSRLETLLKVLPGDTWNRINPRFGEWVFRIVRDPSPGIWRRVQRYASWMRRVNIEDREILGEDTVRQLRINSPAGGWFPALRILCWTITEYNLPYIDLLFSPYLEGVAISTPPSWSLSRFPRHILPALASTISTLPTPTLRILSIGAGGNASPSDTPWACFEDSFSSAVLRCGSSLETLVSPMPLSEAAVDHLIRLPHLCVWGVEGHPPNYSTSSPPFVFPPLVEFGIGESSRGWLSMFQHLEDHVLTTRDVTPLYRVKESLKTLSVDIPSTAPTIDISLTSPIQIFRNLVELDVESDCLEGQCAFELEDDNVSQLAMALPHLERLHLGSPCQENTCATTVACLLQISVHCLKLEVLKIHFNTTNIADDLANISVAPRFKELCPLPRGTLWHLDVHEMPLSLDESNFGAVVDGMVDIFPSLERFAGHEATWGELNKKLEALPRT